MSKKRRLAYAALIVNTVVWGLAAPIVKPALSVVTPEKFLFYRFLLAAIITCPYLLIMMKRVRLSTANLIKIVLLELLGTTLLLWMIYTALKLTTAVESALIYSTSPLFVTIAGIIFLRERETKNEWRGLALALIGTIIITLSPLLGAGKLTFSGSFAGNTLMIAQNILWAVYLILAKKIYRRVPKLIVTGISFWVGLISFYILAGGNQLSQLLADMTNLSVFFAVVYMAILGSIVGATTYLFAQNLIEVSEATIFTYLEAFVAIPAAVFFLKEPLTPWTMAGIAVIAIGVYINGFKK